MEKVIFALKNKIPYAVISVGATEAFVIAQYRILSEEEILNSRETWVANMQFTRGHEHRGITISEYRGSRFSYRSCKDL